MLTFYNVQQANNVPLFNVEFVVNYQFPGDSLKLFSQLSDQILPQNDRWFGSYDGQQKSR